MIVALPGLFSYLLSSLNRDETTIFYMVYMEEMFFPRFFALYLQTSNFVSIPRCPMDYLFHPILLFFFFFLFFCLFFFLLNKAVLLIV